MRYPYHLDAFLRDLAKKSPSAVVLTDFESRSLHAGDESGLEPVVPGAVVQVRNAQEAAGVLQAASMHGVSVTPRGGGSGKAGGAIPDENGIVLTLKCEGVGIDIDPINRLAIVDAGVILASLAEAASSFGLRYGPDPASMEIATVGGTIATNAAGPGAFRHGSTLRWVQGVEMVSGGGEIVGMGPLVSKISAGPQLLSMVVGSEGILGVITRVALRLEPAPSSERLVMMVFLNYPTMVQAVEVMLRLRLPIRAIELLDEAAIEALRKEGRKLDGASDGARAVLLVELEGEEMELDHAIERLAASVEALAHEVIVARNERLRLRLWQVRSEASRALRRSARFKLSEDVVVPRPQLGALLEVCQRIKESHKVRIAAYGHAGDANLHVNFLWDEPSDRARVEMAIAELMAQVIWLGGGLSGEHGIGRAKVGFVGKGGDAQRLRWLREFKRLFDPAWIMNPGKVIPRSD